MGGKIVVAMVIQTYLPLLGGAEIQLASLVPLIKEYDVEVFIMTRHFPKLKRFEYIDGIPVYRLPAPGPKAIKAIVFTIFALSVLKRIKPDLIHTHELLSPTTVGLIAKKIWGVPVATKVLRGGILGDIAKLKRKVFGQSRIRAIVGGVDRFVVISNEIDQELSHVGVPTAKRCFIPNGVNTDKFSPLTSQEEKLALRQKLLLPLDAPIALYTGRFSKEKCLDVLVMSWKKIRMGCPKAELLFLGSGDEEGYLKSISGEGVSFLGYASEVEKYLQAADVFVLPSETEGLSNALLEAMSCGLGIVATNVGGAPDLIIHGENGFLVEPRSIDDLSDCITQLFLNNPLRKRMGDGARIKICEAYGLKSTAKNLVSLYKNILN